MRLLVHELGVEKIPDWVYFAPLTDLHVGARDFDRRLFSDWVRALTDTDKVVVPFLLGDIGEFISYNDKRFSSENVDPSYTVEDLQRLAQAQVDDAIRLLLPVADKLAWAAKGNHERTVERAGVYDPHRDLCRRLGVRDAGYSGLANIRIVRGHERHSIKLFYHHGWFGGSQGNRVNKLHQAIQRYPVDVAVVGHGHAFSVAYSDSVHVDQTWTNWGVRQRLGVMCAAWKKGHDRACTTYEEVRGYEPKHHGPTLIRVCPYTRESTAMCGISAFKELAQ